MSYFPTTKLYDESSDKYARIDASGKLLIGDRKRLIGAVNITVSGLFTGTPTGTGSATFSNDVTTIATGTTANSAYNIVTTQKARFGFGRINLYKALMRFKTAGTTNNIRQFGIYVDSNNSLGFMLSGSTFSVFYRKAGTTTNVNSGSFNGNGTMSSQSYSLDANFHAFEIEYYAARIVFKIDGVAIHTLIPTTATFISSLLAYGFWDNTNSGGSTTNVELECAGFGIFQNGMSIDNPQSYSINAVAETRTLKSGGGTLQGVLVTRSGANNAAMTIYDNTAGSGKIIGIWDLNAAASVGSFPFGTNGLNFDTGLTYVTSGNMTAAAVTILWE